MAMFGIPPHVAAQQTRYHYLGAIPVTVALCIILQQLGRLPILRMAPRPLVLCTLLALGAYGYLRSGFQVPDNAASRAYIARTLRDLAAEVSGAPPGPVVVLENGRSPKLVLGPANPNATFPGRAAVLVLHEPSGVVAGRPVRFIERDPAVLARCRRRPDAPLARLLLGCDRH
jgi:hypothetical protein